MFKKNILQLLITLNITGHLKVKQYSNHVMYGVCRQLNANFQFANVNFLCIPIFDLLTINLIPFFPPILHGFSNLCNFYFWLTIHWVRQKADIVHHQALLGK